MAVAARNGLARIVQQDLSGGMFPSLAPELIPPNGAFDILNGLLDEQNVVYRRGGTSYLSQAPLGEVRALWSGLLTHGGQQTIVGSSEGTFRLEKAQGNREAANLSFAAPSTLRRVTAFQGRLYFSGGKTFDGESSGTVAGEGASKPFYATAANRLLYGSGSRIGVSNVPKKEGDAVVFEGAVVTPTITTTAKSATATVSSATGVSIGQPIESAAAGIPQGTTIANLVSTTVTLSSPATNTTEAVPCAIGQANFLVLPEGAEILGMYGFRNACAVFTTEGIWVVSGLARQITDSSGNVQWSQDRYSPHAVLWGDAGLAGWEGGLVVPAKDGVWLMEFGVSSEKSAPFVPISGPITNLYRGYVAAGCRPGLASVYRGHYFLPVLKGAAVVDVLVCRLDVHGRPWTHLSGFGANIAAYTTSAEEQVFIGATAGLGRVLSTSTYFEPAHSSITDADGSSVPFSVTYRDIATGALNPNTVLKARLRYRLSAPQGTYLSMSFGETAFGGAEWGEFNWGEANWTAAAGPFKDLGGEAPPDPEAVLPFVWHVRRKVRYARVKVELHGPANSCSLRALELFVRQDGRLI